MAQSRPIASCDHTLGHIGESKSRDHQQLLREIMFNMEACESTVCLMCALKMLQEDRAERIYGPNFNYKKYRFQMNMRELEGLIKSSSSVDVIPEKYITLMRKICDQRYGKSPPVLQLDEGYTLSIPSCMVHPMVQVPARLVHPLVLEDPTVMSHPEGVNVREREPDYVTRHENPLEEGEDDDDPPAAGWGNVYGRMGRNF